MVNNNLKYPLDYKLTLKKLRYTITESPKMISRICFKGQPAINFDGVDIPFSMKAHNLGVIFDQHLSWNQQLR